ncbi:MAG TPA: hypothetical protein VHV52_00715 [Gaiellaceae bacterium]|jgi:hypothetical protein|nr:hypothetical protein [Gaiellaceae bacterium]
MRAAVLRLAPVFAIWAAAATALAIPARRVVDWFLMTDELLYERLAFSVVRTGSPLPSLRGQHVPLTNFLYPLLLASVAGEHLVPSFLTRAHTLNAIMMTSAAVPAYLFARDVLRSRLLPYAAAALTVLVPWLVLASFLLTESAAYPAFIWAVYLLQRAVARPSVSADILALGGLVLATLARTQLAVLVIAAPVAVLLREGHPRTAAERHRVLAAATVLGVLAVIAIVVSGHGSGALGSYSVITKGSFFDAETPRALAQHAATLALALGLLPAVAGAAWLSARAFKREPGALVASLAIVLVLLEATLFDINFGATIPYDRYLFYLAPLLLTGFLGTLEDVRLPRWSLAVPLVLVVAGLATAPLPTFVKLNVETPAATLDDYLLRSAHGIDGAREMLVASTLLLLAIFVLARMFVPRQVVAAVLVAATAALLTGETVYAFDRLLSVDGTSGRPITVTQGVVFDWIDRTVGPTASVTMIPYAQISTDYWATAAFWWDLEFWNRSVVRAAYPDNKYAEIQASFPKLPLHFDPATGRTNVSPTPYVAESDLETRFRFRGPTVTLQRNVRLIEAGSHWQVDWLSFGLDDDGFTDPGRVATVRVYPKAGQTTPLRRFVNFQLESQAAGESADFTSNAGAWNAQLAPKGELNEVASVCVPPHGFATIRVRAHGSTKVYGDIGTRAGIIQGRTRGVLVERISLADETGAC